MYSNIDRDIRSRDLKEALELLEKAGVIIKVRHTGSNGLPLEAEVKENTFKAVFLDIGLMQNICGLNIYRTQIVDNSIMRLLSNVELKMINDYGT